MEALGLRGRVGEEVDVTHLSPPGDPPDVGSPHDEGAGHAELGQHGGQVIGVPHAAGTPEPVAQRRVLGLVVRQGRRARRAAADDGRAGLDQVTDAAESARGHPGAGSAQVEQPVADLSRRQVPSATENRVSRPARST